MRVAVLADIHGNLPALDAVLGEVEAAGVDAAPDYPDLAGFVAENVRTVPSDALALESFKRGE
jgi:hypothetical protein